MAKIGKRKLIGRRTKKHNTKRHNQTKGTTKKEVKVEGTAGTTWSPGKDAAMIRKLKYCPPPQKVLLETIQCRRSIRLKEKRAALANQKDLVTKSTESITVEESLILQESIKVEETTIIPPDHIKAEEPAATLSNSLTDESAIIPPESIKGEEPTIILSDSSELERADIIPPECIKCEEPTIIPSDSSELEEAALIPPSSLKYQLPYHLKIRNQRSYGWPLD